MSCTRVKTLFLLLISVITLIGCSSSRYAMHQDRAPKHDINVKHIADAVPRVEPLSKYGNQESYVVRGRRYHIMKRPPVLDNVASPPGMAANSMAIVPQVAKPITCMP